MPRSFLIKKTETAEKQRGKGMIFPGQKEDGFIGVQFPTFHPFRPYDTKAFLSEDMYNYVTSKSLQLPIPLNVKLKREIYNEFFVLDDPDSRGNIKEELDGQDPTKEEIKAEIILQSGESCDKVPSTNVAGELSPKALSEDNDKVYQCKYCNKSFTRSWNFQRHVLIHTGRKPHKCDKCPKAFVLAAHLKIHNRIHTGEKPYKCNICGRGFAQLTNLQRHVLTHTGEKPHKCSYCDKGFVSSSDLRRHVRIHTGEKPYKCKVCSKAFTTSGNLQSHVLTHTGEKPYQCNICSWKFISSSNLRTHVRTHHYQQINEKKTKEMCEDEGKTAA